MDAPQQIILKNGTLKPTSLTLNLTEGGSSPCNSILLKVINDKIQSYSDVSSPRKYIFMIEELDEQTDPMSAGDQHLFQNLQKYKSGKYHLTCINYPKLQCEIEIINQEIQALNERKSNTIINLSGLESVEEKEQQNKEDFGKEENEWAKSQEEIHENPLGTPKKAQISDFDKLLLQKDEKQQSIQNRYLRYFQEEFKIWKNFFADKEEPCEQTFSEENVCTPMKQKPKSEHRKNSENMEQIKMENWSKRDNRSPAFEFTLSCGSASNNQNSSEFQKQKDKTVLSLLNSQDNYRNDEELEKEVKAMKKTNSEYRLSIQDVGEKKDSEADTASKKKEKKYNGETFMKWLDSWAEGQEALSIKQKDDEHLVKQWLGHLQNKFKIAKFIHS